jgi:hypothetical protein
MAAFVLPVSPSVIVMSSIEIDGGVTAIIDRGSSVSPARLASVGRPPRGRDVFRRRNRSAMAWDVWEKNQLRRVMGHLVEDERKTARKEEVWDANRDETVSLFPTHSQNDAGSNLHCVSVGPTVCPRTTGVELA